MLIKIVFAVVIAVRINTCHGLQCYSCTYTEDPALCLSTTTCSAGESCFEITSTLPDTIYYSKGCLSVQMCAQMDKEFQWLGKRQVGMCHQCCSTDNCNNNPCTHPSMK